MTHHRPSHATLFQLATIAGLELANRVVVAPMTRASATEDGRATPRMAEYYADFASGGFGLIVSEGIYTDRAHSQGYANQPGLTDDAQVAAWRRVTEAVHAAGGRIFAQLMHAGGQGQFNRFVSGTVAPSAIAPKGAKLANYGAEGPYDVPRALDRDGLRQIRDGFVASARNAVEAGFDGIEIHGANGYLLDQFLTDYTNARDDVYGGDVGARVRFPAEVVTSVSAAVGLEVPVGIRLSQIKVGDNEHEWAGGLADAKVIFASMAMAGADFVHISEFDARRPAFAGIGPSLAAVARSFSGLPVMVAGDLGDAPRAAAVLADGEADFVAIGKAALADPLWAWQVRSGATAIPFDGALFSNGPTIEGVDAWRRVQMAMS